MIELLLVVCGITLGLMAALVVVLKQKLLLIETTQKEISALKLEQAQAIAELAELHKATVEKYNKVSETLSGLKSEVNSFKLAGPTYGMKR